MDDQGGKEFFSSLPHSHRFRGPTSQQFSGYRRPFHQG